MREKIKRIPVLGRIATTIYESVVIVWKWITHKLLRQQISRSRWNKIRREILRDFSDSEDMEIKELVDNVKRQGAIRTFNYPFFECYNSHEVEVFYDNDQQEEDRYPYVIYVTGGGEQRRIYFPKECSKEAIAKSYCDLLIEQDKNSPHCYTNDEFQVKQDAVILDLGTAEGNFSIELVDRAKHIYLFEGDQTWWRPLELTFKDWKEKVTVIHKYVSDTDDENYISLKTFLADKNFNKEKLFIKMDIEGYEECVLEGGLSELQNLLREHVDLTMAVCSYHKQDSEDRIRELLIEIGFKNIKPSGGFMILNNFCEDRIYPYFRRGLLFASAQINEEKIG